MTDGYCAPGRYRSRSPHPPQHPDLRTPGHPDPRRPRLHNRALAAARAPVERGMARLKPWEIFRRSRISPNRMTVITKAVLTLERQR